MAQDDKHRSMAPDQSGGDVGGKGQGGGTTPLEKGTGDGRLGYIREGTIIDAYPATPAPILNIPGAPPPQNSGGGSDTSGDVSE